MAPELWTVGAEAFWFTWVWVWVIKAPAKESLCFGGSSLGFRLKAPEKSLVRLLEKSTRGGLWNEDSSWWSSWVNVLESSSTLTDREFLILMAPLELNFWVKAGSWTLRVGAGAGAGRCQDSWEKLVNVPPPLLTFPFSVELDLKSFSVANTVSSSMRLGRGTDLVLRLFLLLKSILLFLFLWLCMITSPLVSLPLLTPVPVITETEPVLANWLLIATAGSETPLGSKERVPIVAPREEWVTERGVYVKGTVSESLSPHLM